MGAESTKARLCLAGLRVEGKLFSPMATGIEAMLRGGNFTGLVFCSRVMAACFSLESGAQEVFSEAQAIGL